MQRLSALLPKLTILMTIIVFVAQTIPFCVSTAAMKPAVSNSSPAAAPFTPGNLVVYRVGSGADGLTNTGSPVFLDEYTPTGTLVQSLPMPATAAGANRQLIASGTAPSEGLVTRSADGRYLLLTGYARNLGGANNLTSTTGADVPRTIGRVDASGAINTSTALADFASGSSPRSAASGNGTDLWVAGGAGGVRYAALGASSSTQISSTLTNARQVNVFNNQLYVSHDTTTGGQSIVAAVGSGLPTVSGQTIVGLPGLPVAADAGTNAYSFFFADLTASVAGLDTLYIADEDAGVRKYSLVGGSWAANGAAGASADSYRGLTGVASGTNVTLYATRKGGSGAAGGGELVTLIDSAGYNAPIAAPPILLATATANTAWRGVALAPVAGTSNAARNAPADFNGDGKTDFAVARNASGTLNWFTLVNGTNEFRSAAFGAPGDRLTPEDFDGDGRDDIAVWRSGAQGAFYILQSSNNAFVTQRFGQTGDDPTVVADFDGDKKADPAVYRPALLPGGQSFYYYRSSAAAGSDFVAVPFGTSGDKPYPGDFDGDGRADFGVVRNNNGSAIIYIAKSTGGTEVVYWGLFSDVFAPGDYDNDGKTDFAAVRTTGGALTWYVMTRANATQTAGFGAAGDSLAQGDYNGDGATDYAVWRAPAGGQAAFYVLPSGGTSFSSHNWGQSGDTPVAGYNSR